MAKQYVATQNTDGTITVHLPGATDDTLCTSEGEAMPSPKGAKVDCPQCWEVWKAVDRYSLGDFTRNFWSNTK